MITGFFEELRNAIEHVPGATHLVIHPDDAFYAEILDGQIVLGVVVRTDPILTRGKAYVMRQEPPPRFVFMTDEVEP
jgi:hypothetical protein